MIFICNKELKIQRTKTRKMKIRIFISSFLQYLCEDQYQPL